MQKKINTSKYDITPCEMRVLQVLWETTDEMTLQDINEKVNFKYRCIWGKGAVCAFLRRLVKKGFAEKNRRSRVDYYKALITQEEWMLLHKNSDIEKNSKKN